MIRVTRFNGAKIRELRRIRGWSLEELSQRSGLSISHLSALETGNRKSPSVDLVYDLAEALHVSMYYFINQDTTTQMNIDMFTYPTETKATPSDEFTRNSSLPTADEHMLHWTRTLRPETLSFMLHEEAESYLTFAHDLYEHRHSSAQLVQLMNEFIQKANQSQIQEKEDSDSTNSSTSPL
ncbi:MAG: helix-turn-helix transcriptional regulator [Acidibacillus sp.]|uniref:HTH cro/C1-type domain-containing protein n=1 Tax=Sulfoacidibacillus ferrooxidans TaxID=2005001 RepID=A0A9X2ABD0_9BACL|nr:helix-turn-helix transcriptional regulator [Sulfoacidibacillus ferrooxidans]MCI0182574.1 hypothetical protein [Sulfoacidibacillus ferrooxidans]MCY0894153.1 helix-turn-helix transcriptional regulator [Acidibacillus sp.]